MKSVLGQEMHMVKRDLKNATRAAIQRALLLLVHRLIVSSTFPACLLPTWTLGSIMRSHGDPNGPSPMLLKQAWDDLNLETYGVYY